MSINPFYLQDYLEHLFSNHLNDFIVANYQDSSSHSAILKGTKNPQLGDFQINGCLSSAKKLKINPQQLAQGFTAYLLGQEQISKIISKAEVAGPGFINLTLNDSYLNSLSAKLFNDLTQLTQAHQGTVVVDYSSPNIAKEMHVGHLRSTVIGDSISRILEFLGYKVIRQNHLGDWGTQFGMLIAYLEKQQQQDNFTISDLDLFYKQSKAAFDQDPEFADYARSLVVKLQANDPEILKKWQFLVDVTVAQNNKLYQQLEIKLNDQDIDPESFYNPMLDNIRDSLLEQAIASYDKGAVVVKLEEFKTYDGEALGVLIEKSNGGYLYTTTDLAAINYRCHQLKADRIIYVVDNRQAQHFQQLEIIARKAGFLTDNCSLEHHDFGMILGQDNKPYKSRSGDVIKLQELLEEGFVRASALVAQRDHDLTPQQANQVAQNLAISSIKYADLIRNRTTNYQFNWDTMLNFDGNTAPYMLYAYARINSIFKKQQLDLNSYPIKIELNSASPAIERELTLKLLTFSGVIKAASQGYPHLICSYLFETAHLFSSFYEQCQVIGSEQQTSRLSIAAATAKLLQQGLDLLGIKTLEKM